MHCYGVWEHFVLAIGIGNDFYTGAVYHPLHNLVYLEGTKRKSLETNPALGRNE